jgi:transposase
MHKPNEQKKPLNDLSRSLTPIDPNQTLIGVIEMGKKSWLVAGIIPGVERQPLKKLTPDEDELLKLLERWRAEAEKAGHKIDRITVAFEAGRDGFWLARWLRARGIEAHVIHAASVAVSREHRRAKTDRLDTEQLKRAADSTRSRGSGRGNGCYSSNKETLRYKKMDRVLGAPP